MDMDFVVAGKRNRHNMFKSYYKGVPVDYSIIKKVKEGRSEFQFHFINSSQIDLIVF